MIKNLIIAILIALPAVASANSRDKYPKVKTHHRGFNYKKHHRKSQKWRRQARRNPNCRHNLHV